MTGVPKSPSFETIVERRLSRRQALKGAAGASAWVALSGGSLFGLSGCDGAVKSPPLTFAELEHGYDETHHVADGYVTQVLIRWGDAVLPGAAPFRPGAQTKAEQDTQFGTANDFIGFLPLPFGSDNSEHGLLCVNHEFTVAMMMFPGFDNRWRTAEEKTRAQADVEVAAHGHSVIEVKRVDGQWTVVGDSPYNRRITGETPIALSGPAAGHRRLKTSADPEGRTVLGTLGNCAGGVTPWGTVLTAEENFGLYFYGDQDVAAETAAEERRNWASHNAGFAWVPDHDAADPETAPPVRSLPSFYGWSRFYDRFHIEKEPREFNRFGWMVEFDPYDPQSVPKKRTALGRFAHEGTTVVAEHGKPVVAYSGDDARHEFVYRFVSRGSYDATNRAANMDLLDDGDLFAARFDADGTGEWIKLELKETGPASAAESGLSDPGEVLIDAREIARRLGATPMDRPEDVETNPLTGRTYVMLTNNSRRKAEETDAANPRAENLWGQILEILPPGEDGARDHLSNTFAWDLFLLAGDPNHPETAKQGSYHAGVSGSGWFANPDNVAFDPEGRMWVATDGFPGNKTPAGDAAPVHDGIWACETVGENRALTKHFFGCPRGAEMCGPCFTPDGTTLFVAVQHPGLERGSTFDNPSTRWPDFDPDMPPRDAVVAITKKDGGTVGS